MRAYIWRLLVPALAVVLLSASTAMAQDKSASALSDDFLSGYDYVIGDTGDHYAGWDRVDTRVYARVITSSGEYREHYFESLPAAFFVLRERYGSVRVAEMRMPEAFGGQQIDATRAYFVWDNTRVSRGNLPLVLAFRDYEDASHEARSLGGGVYEFSGVLQALSGWYDDSRPKVYWRGYHTWEPSRWNRVYSRRWDGYDWDRSHGWANLSFRLGNVNVSIGSGSPRGRSLPRYIYPAPNSYRYSSPRYITPRHVAPRPAVAGQGEQYERRNRDRDRDRTRDRDRDRGNDRARERERGNDRGRNGGGERGRGGGGGRDRGGDRGRGGSSGGGSGGSSGEKHER